MFNQSKQLSPVYHDLRRLLGQRKHTEGNANPRGQGCFHNIHLSRTTISNAVLPSHSLSGNSIFGCSGYQQNHFLPKNGFRINFKNPQRFELTRRQMEVLFTRSPFEVMPTHHFRLMLFLIHSTMGGGAWP